MLRRSSFRRTVCRIAAGAILFGQIAVSAYACTAMVADETPTEHAVTISSADCDGMFESVAVAANLCTEHCKYGQQVDQSQHAPVAAPVLVYLYRTPAFDGPVADRAAFAEAQLAPSPPHTILHCCLRI